jgi:hypothetical protein
LVTHIWLYGRIVRLSRGWTNLLGGSNRIVYRYNSMANRSGWRQVRL